MRCSRYTHVFLVRAPLYPLPYIHLIPPLCRALMRGCFTHGTEKEDVESEKLRVKDGDKRRGENARARCVTNGSRVSDQGPAPGLFEKDLKISLYDSALLKPALKRIYLEKVI
ncbi:unnamed protein product [Lasius platythorax]|uniref:Uncharacterized protein n=1 Tax=Lasius platythorax TaxID=488582 RepID=A0AAV2N407_9HYME